MAAGTPLPVGRSLVGVVGVVLVFLFFFLAFGWPATEEGPSPWLVPVGTGVVLDVLVVVLDDEPDPLCEGEVEVEGEVAEPVRDGVEELVGVLEVVGGAVVVVVVVVTDTAGVVAVVGAHCSLSEATGPVIGRPIAEMGVPGGTFTLKTRVWPLTKVTVTVQASADAVGMAARAMATKIAPAMASTASSFRRPIMAALLLRPSRWCALQ
ncbi:MAG TPA: hypothetical protein VHW96_18620 [Solirubrobacteraceae bacterium]|nr:hypothetical protein [Solirubrobacteraceae bacterium]